MRILHYVLIGILLGILSSASAGDEPKRVPLLDGGFWQVTPGLIAEFTDEQLAQEVGHFRALGMDLIVIQYAGSEFDREAGTYLAYVHNDVLPVHPAFAGRDPIGAIMRAAEEHGVRVMLGGLLMPMDPLEQYEENVRIWTSPQAMAYRFAIFDKYAESKALYGYYTPNEPNPHWLYRYDCDPNAMIEATDYVVDSVKRRHPGLVVVKSIGLYMMPAPEGATYQWEYASEKYLDAFWRPWVEQCDTVDAWMVIDGVGTRLSSLEHTSMAQAWAARLAREHGKAFWTDVENAYMDPYPAVVFTMEELGKSLDVAAQHGSTLVTFDYIHYMSRQSPKEKARELHEAYEGYRAAVLERQ